MDTPDTTTTTNDGGPAFPTDHSRDEAFTNIQGGMSLRDYFAAQAIQVMVYKTEDRDGGWDHVAVAVGCYQLADALIAERAKAEGHS